MPEVEIVEIDVSQYDWTGRPAPGEVWVLNTNKSIGPITSIDNDPDYNIDQYYDYFKDLDGLEVKIVKIKKHTVSGVFLYYWHPVNKPTQMGRLIQSSFSHRIEKHRSPRYLDDRCCLPHLGLCDRCKAQFRADMQSAKRRYQPELRTYAER